MSTDLQPFDVCGELPTGTTVLEASAGTGKTYTIAALAARYIAEGVAELSELMLVTFGRMATNELRLRVRERLVRLEARLAAAQSAELRDGMQQPLVPPDAVEQLLICGDRIELSKRHQRVAAALAEFDAATIATTHEFCLSMLDGLGVLADREPAARFVEQLSDLTREAAGDLYLRRYATSGRPPLDFDAAVQLAQAVVENPHARLVPAGLNPTDYPEAAETQAFAAEVRAEVERRKRAGRLFTYDDMLIRLRNALADPVHGAAAADRLRNRFRIVLVDEFQDTDPIQWEILRRGFHGYVTLILIGDPKQAIYAFRGADVFSYLEAVQQADWVRTLATNWRSDAALVQSVEKLIGGAALGDSRIVVRSVRANQPGHRLLTRSGDPCASFRLRLVEHAVDAETVLPVAQLRPKITADLVADITAMLASGATLAHEGSRRPVDPADIAVLVRTNERGESIRDALVAADVPAIMFGASSVYASTAAEDWLTLFMALEQPRQQFVRRAALTCFIGWTFSELATASEPALVALTQQVRSWSRVLAARGVAALVEAVTCQTGLPERLLRSTGGERLLTDLRHIGQSLHAAMVSGQLGISTQVEWLRDRMAEARSSGLSDRTRRLETDARAITVLTVHASKGLEFPLVYLPDAWDQHVDARDDGRTLRLHETDLDHRSVCELDVGGLHAPGRSERFAQHLAEESGEQLRLLYVALTRAECQVVTWWAPSRNTPTSPLQRFLYRPGEAGAEPAASYALRGDPQTLPRLRTGFLVEKLTPRAPTAWRPSAEGTSLGTPRTFDRILDLDWRRTSYSSLTAAVHGLDLVSAGVSSEAEFAKENDESTSMPEEVTRIEQVIDRGPGGAATAVTDDARSELVSPMQDLPVGVEFGSLVHSVLEAVDPRADPLAAELRKAVAIAIARTPGADMSADVLADALLLAMQTPLGPLAYGRRLSDISTADRLPELAFELPLAGGDHPTAELTLGVLGPLLRRHLKAEDLLLKYSEALEHPLLAGETLRGYLNGSIDAVLRVPDANGVPRYLLVDYKTNWLGSQEGGRLLVTDYAPHRMARAMMEAHYPLQALLYSVALHRLLRWRQPGYQPDVHLGGVLYLFVRGMAGPQAPQNEGVPYGVFSWRPPAALVTQLSDLLHGRAT
ncbi:MAG TPA: UvrD-helicase domain-containing protein [Propionibacteriaceae bacterium]|nr:UvrD-helicase domain-containing protein [Propionibacteriaceae bacterium]